MTRKQSNSDSLYEAMNPVRLTNTIMERMYLRLFGELATNRFKWTGLPKEIDPRFVELTLYMRGMSVFFFDNDKIARMQVDGKPAYDKYMCLRGSGFGGLDMYDNYAKYLAFGNTMINRTLEADECVPIWCNTMRIPDYDVITTYAHRLTVFDRSIDSTVALMRTPLIIAVEQSQRLSVLNMWRQTQEGQPVIIGSPEMMKTIQEGIAVFPVGAHGQTLHDLQIGKTRVWNEAMTFLGINSANQEKKERLVADEVSANDKQVEGFQNSALGARKLAAERINEMFGLSVEVEWNEAVNEMLTDEPSLGQQDIQDNNDSKKENR